MGIEFRILGPLEVWAGERAVRPGGRKQRTLLAALLLHAGEPVSADRLVDALWGERAPASAGNTLQGYVSDLRRALDPGHPQRGRGGVVVTESSGYRLAVEPDQVDARRFERLVSEGRAALAGGAPERAAATLGQALRLWRGPALAEVASEPFARAEAARLDELRLGALEDQLEAELSAGGHHRVVAELRRLVDEHPLRERLWGQLMIALYRSGRQAEALEAYRQARRILSEELGVEPTPGLRAVHEAVLKQDASLEVASEREPSAAASGAGHAVARAQPRQETPAPVGAATAPVTSPGEHGTAAPGPGADDDDGGTAAGRDGEPPTNLPAPLTTFIGRASEIAGVLRRLAESRLVTLGGVGGCGKTRLALEVATRLVTGRPGPATSDPGAPHPPADGFPDEPGRTPSPHDYPDGVWLVELQSLEDTNHLPHAIASALGLTLQGPPAAESLAGWLRHRRLLLLLDNCEHLVDACGRLAHRLLTACPGLRILATSRQRLGIPGEAVWHVPSLQLPDPGPTSPEALANAESVALFCDRAASAVPGWRLQQRDAAAVVDICHRLDGIPFAIELAAARLPMLSCAELAARLEDRFAALAARPAVLPRHRTLRATMDWSHDLLSPAEQALLRRLSVFAGSFTMRAVEAVCLPGREPGAALDLVSGLVDKSLVVVSAGEDETRYRLLEFVRQYGRERLEAAGEAAEVRTRHRDWFVERAERLLPGPDGGPMPWQRPLDEDIDDLRAALTWSRERGDAEALLRLAAAFFWSWWWWRGDPAEGRRWLEEALRAPGDASTARALALTGAGQLAMGLGDFDAAVDRAGQGLALAERLGDHWIAVAAASVLGTVAWATGDYLAAESAHADGLALARRHGHRWAVAVHLHGLGRVASARGDHESAAERYEESLALFQEIGLETGVAVLLQALGEAFLAVGDDARAAELLEASLARYDRVVYAEGKATTLHCLASLRHRRGEHDTAEGLFVDSLRLLSDLGHRPGIAHVLEGLARLDADRGVFERSAWLLGAASRIRKAVQQPVAPAERPGYDSALARVRSGLGQTAFERAWDRGASAPVERAVAVALGSQTEPSALQPPSF